MEEPWLGERGKVDGRGDSLGMGKKNGWLCGDDGAEKVG